MAISFPRSRPESLRTVSMSFILQFMQEVTPTRGGSQLAIDIGPALWSADWSTPPLEEEDFGEARAFFDTLASDQAFYAYDTLREYPVTYRDTGWTGLLVGASPFDGICFLTAVQENAVELTLTELPIGFVLKPGDYIAFDYGASDQYRALHRIAAGGVADGTGEMAIEVRPPVIEGWEGGDSPGHRAVSLYRPSAKMIVLPGSYSETVPVNRRASCSFKAVQDLGA